MYHLQERLANFQSKGLTRNLVHPRGIDLSSSDYLGFAQDPELKKRYLARLQNYQQIGSGASRLLRGNLDLFTQTEKIVADFVGREASLLFSTGYAANVGLLSALLKKSDHVFSDELNHASIIDGISLSKANKTIFPHRDYAVLEQALEKTEYENNLKIIISESMFSMEGTHANLEKLVELSKKYKALLLIDEAHAVGLYGAGLVATQNLNEDVFATVHAAGKALGASGAWVSGSKFLKDYLTHFARSFIFSTAPIPAVPILLQEAIKYYQEVGGQRAEIVKQRAMQLREKISIETLGEQDCPIVPIMIGDNHRAISVAEKLQARGWDVRAIRPPTVPPGTARLRVTVKWCNTEDDLNNWIAELHSALNS
jgi:8-amino-7-oxononanoate synthase